jgi:beta-glucosidase
VATFCGGGSASLNPYYSTSVLDSIRSVCDNVRYSEGPFSHMEFALRDSVITDTQGNPGFTFRTYLEPAEVKDRKCMDTKYVKTTKFFLTDYSVPGSDSSLFWAEMEATLKPDRSGPWSFGLCVHGTARLFIDGVEVVDNETRQEPGNAFLGAGTQEVFGTVDLQAGKLYNLLVTFGSAPTSKIVNKGVVTFRKGGVRLRGGPHIDTDAAMQEVMQTASAAEQVVVVAGLNVSLPPCGE